MMKLDRGYVNIRRLNAPWYCNRRLILKLLAPLLVAMLKGVREFIPIEASGTSFL